MHEKKRGASRALALAAGLSLVAGVMPAAHAVTGTAPAAPASTTAAFEDGSYIVVLADRPLATFPATAGSTTAKVDTTSATAVSHTERLLAQQSRALSAVGAEATHQYTVALNGFSAALTAEQAAALAARSDVVSVTPSTIRSLATGDVHEVPDGVQVPTTDVSPDFLGLRGEDGVWEQVGGPMAAGAGLVVGVIDTGIAYDNPSFDDEGMPAPPASWSGACEEGEDPGFPADACSDKLVGARYFVEGLRSYGATVLEAVNPADHDDHGSHVAGTAVGREVTLQDDSGGAYAIAGMAPGAHLATYKVCWDFEFEGEQGNGCADEDSVAAIDQALTDGVDVLNFSISGDPVTYTDPVDLAFKNAAAAGVFVATASGNEGDDGGTVNHTGPWMTTVGAATHRGADAPSIAYFSNPGPVDVPAAEQTVLKPDLGAPGVEVLAPYSTDAETAQWGYMSGTSMASPHVAGLGALLASANPTWSPMAVKSALQTSARSYTDTASNTAFVGGAGFVEPRDFLAPGLVFDSTTADWDAFLADPAGGYDLNAAYVVVPQLGTTPTTVTRTVTNPGQAEATFAATYAGPDTLDVTVSPESVTVPAGGTAEVTVTVANTGAATDTWQEGRITWTSGETAVEIPVLAGGEVADEAPEPGPEVERVSGKNRYATAAAVSENFPEAVDTVYIASGQGGGYADALAGSAPAASGLLPQGKGTLNTPEGDPAPVLLVRQDSVPSVTAQALEDLEPSNIVILGGETAISADVEEALADYGQVSRVAGSNRYETAANVAQMFGEDVDTVYLASGDELAFADALSGAARAGMEGAPVLLTRPGSVPGATLQALEALNPERIVVLGGPIAVTDEVFEQVGADERISGPNRYGTAVAVSQVHEGDVPLVYVASGMDYPDALAGSALAGHQEVPVLLTRQGSLPGATALELERLNPEQVIVLGGPVAVSDEVLDDISEIWGN